ARQAFNTTCQEVAKLVTQILALWNEVREALPQFQAQQSAYEDMQSQLHRLMHKRFIVDVPYTQLRHYPRYLRALLMRMDKIRTDPLRDQRWQAEITALTVPFLGAQAKITGSWPPKFRAFQWQLEIGRASCRKGGGAGGKLLRE